ncbi:MAG: hypothetical protein IH874_00205 [Candidatus Dadabacteria bacterium]|nr:hypothetical protein [Candidatus Dadabacteria bacterium]
MRKFMGMLLLCGFIAFGAIGGCLDSIDEFDLFVSCQSPPLNSDFSDRVVIFIDPFTLRTAGVTSFGDVVQIFFADDPNSQFDVSLGAEPLSGTLCEIAAGAFDTDMDGDFLDEVILDATGDCGLTGGRTSFFIENLELAGFPESSFDGDCSDIIFLASAAGSGENMSAFARLELIRSVTLDAQRKFRGSVVAGVD